jgi:hypothetical protein
VTDPADGPLPNELPTGLADISGVSIGQSAFVSGPAVWAGGKEICHRDASGGFDVRLTRALIKKLKPTLVGDARVTLRRSSASDWLEVTCSGADDDVLLRDLVERAAAAHPNPAGLSAPPPSGGALERRRRFH